MSVSLRKGKPVVADQSEVDIFFAPLISLRSYVEIQYAPLVVNRHVLYYKYRMAIQMNRYTARVDVLSRVQIFGPTFNIERLLIIVYVQACMKRELQLQIHCLPH